MSDKKLKLLIEKFYEWLEVNGYSESTLVSYKRYLSRFISFLSEHEINDIISITPKEIYQYQTCLYYAKTSKGKPLSTLTQHNALSAVRSFFYFLVKTDKISLDPAANIQFPEKPDTLPEVFTVKEIEKLICAPDMKIPTGFRDRAIIEVLYVTGMRNSELRNLKIYDVNLKEASIKITHGKGGKPRVVPLGRIACRFLYEYLLTIRPKLIKNQDQQILFLSRTGKIITATDLTMNIRKYGERAKLPKRITAHSLRHSCATHLLKNGADIRYIQKLLGHNAITSTQIYTKVEPKDLKAVHAKYHPRERNNEI